MHLYDGGKFGNALSEMEAAGKAVAKRSGEEDRKRIPPV